jgi:hypothetical protein
MAASPRRIGLLVDDADLIRRDAKKSLLFEREALVKNVGLGKSGYV